MARREKELNRILRRGDWRFLFEDPGVENAACFCGGGLARAVKMISRSITRKPEAGSCDLVAAANPRQSTLHASYRALREGSRLYTEWYSPFSGGPYGIRCRLEAVGFNEISIYAPWPWPWVRSPKAWLPTDCEPARAYVERGPAQGWLAPLRVGFRVSIILNRLAGRFGLSLPVCAVARKPGPKDGPRRTESSLLLLTGGSRSINKAVGLVFERGNSAPHTVLKMSRIPEAAGGLSREADTLLALQASRPGGLPGAPIVSFAHRHTSVCVVAETALAGRQICELLCDRNYGEMAMKAARWLTLLVGGPVRRHNSAQSIVENFEAAFGPSCKPHELNRARGIIASLEDVPTACEHRDFSPWNVLVNGDGELAVLDWESSEMIGLAGLDLIYFLTYLAFFRDGAIRSGRYRDSYSLLLDPVTLTGSVFRDCFAYYAGATGLDAGALGGLRLLTWMLHAVSEHRRALADGDASPAVLRRGLFFGLWLQELAVTTNVPLTAGLASC